MEDGGIIWLSLMAGLQERRGALVQFRRDWLMNIDRLQQEMDRLLDHFAGSKPPTVRFAPVVWQPAIDLYETEDELVLTVELSGVEGADMEILVERDTFTIRGERKKALRPGGRRAYYQMEIASGLFERTIVLPTAVDAANSRASYEDGLVEVVLPKARGERTLMVRIKTG